jgi:hypothetical protein
MKILKAASRVFKSAFSSYPSQAHSPDAAAIFFRGAQVMRVRGNVYERISGVLAKDAREKYLRAPKKIVAAEDEIKKGDLECILKELRGL